MKSLMYCILPLILVQACAKPAAQDTGKNIGIVRPAPPGGYPAFEDSVLLFSAVRFDPSYDWRRDSLAGKTGFEIVLYKNFMPVLEIACSPDSHFSSDADSHHIVGGRLYTEYADDSAGTVICCDGAEVLRFPAPEKLLGLLPADSSLYTLSRPLSSARGLRFRKDGELLYMHNNVTVCGDFGKASYGATGALYLNDGIPAFAFVDDSGRGYAFIDGKETEVYGSYTDASILDVKAMGKHAVAAWSNYLRIKAVEAELWGDDATNHVVTYTTGASSALVYIGKQRWHRHLAPFEGRIFYSENDIQVLGDPDNGGMQLYSSRNDSSTRIEGCFLASETCAYFKRDGQLWLGLTSSDPDKPGRLRMPDGKESEIKLNGYLTAVEFWTKD